MQNNQTQKLNGAKASGTAFSLAIVLYILVAFLGNAIILLFKKEQGTSLLEYSLTAVFPIIAIIITVVVMGKATKTPLFKLSKVNKFDPLFIIPAVLLVCGMFFGLGFVNVSFAGFLTDIGLNVPQSSVLISTTGEYVLSVFLLAVLPAFFEEVLFRGVVLGFLTAEVEDDFSLQSAFTSSFIVAIFFAIYHGSLAQFFYQLIFGFFTCVLTLNAKSIIPAVISHFLNNFMVLTFNKFGANIDLFGALSISLGALCIVGFILFIMLYKNWWEKRANGKKLGAGWCFAFASVGIAICLTLCIANLFITG